MQDNDPVSYLCTHRLASAIDQLDDIPSNKAGQFQNNVAEILEAVALGKAGMITRSEVLAKIEKALGEALPADSELFNEHGEPPLQLPPVESSMASSGRLQFSSAGATRKDR